MARQRLRQEDIVRAAIAFIDEFGVQSLSMRRLGMSLEVEAMALYNYVSGREELVSLAVDELIDDLFDDELMKERTRIMGGVSAVRRERDARPRAQPSADVPAHDHPTAGAALAPAARARALGRLLPLHPAGLRLLR